MYHEKIFKLPNYSVNKSGDEQETDDDMPDLIDMSGRKKTPKSAKKECKTPTSAKKEPKTPDAAKRSGDEGDWIYVGSARKEPPKTPTSAKREPPKTPTFAKKSGVAPVHQGAFCRVFVERFLNSRKNYFWHSNT